MTHQSYKPTARESIRQAIDAWMRQSQWLTTSQLLSRLEVACRDAERAARAEGFAEGVSSMQRAQSDECKRAAMRALMVVVHDECISSDRAREIVGMTHEEQRRFWREEHRETMLSARSEGFREGQERMRERCAERFRTHFHAWSMDSTANEVAEYILDLPLEVDDA